MNKKDKIFIAGHQGLVGSAILKLLKKRNFENLITVEKSKLDLIDNNRVRTFFNKHQPDYIILAAAQVGGIKSNMTYPTEFLLNNLLIQNNIIINSFEQKVKKIIFLGSSCIYPRECPQPMKEDYLLTGQLEPTNEGYAIAKIAGIKLLNYMYKQYGFKSLNVIPCNLYGCHDHFELEKAHVISALVKKFVDATDDNNKIVEVWGSGNARREFMHVDDFVHALLLVEEKWNSAEIINIGVGYDISIKELAKLISKLVGFRGRIKWNTSMSEGMFRKCLDISKLKEFDFRPKISIIQGIQKAIICYKKMKKKENI